MTAEGSNSSSENMSGLKGQIPVDLKPDRDRSLVVHCCIVESFHGPRDNVVHGLEAMRCMRWKGQQYNSIVLDNFYSFERVMGFMIVEKKQSRMLF